jgi:hypothetical protein
MEINTDIAQKFKIELLYDQLNHFWVATQKNQSKHIVEICMPVFITTLFTIAKLWI